MGWIGHQGWISTIVVALALAGCGGTAQESPADPLDKAKPKSRYDLANRCFVLEANGVPVARAGDGYAADATAGAERFYMKASGLGRYVFYAADQAFLTSDGTAVVAAAAPADGSDWTFAELSPGPGRFTATAAGTALATDAGGMLVPGATPAELTFEPATGCTVYPEMPVGIDAPTFSNRSASRPVIGFAEVHAHMGMGSEMSDGSGDVGPSAGGVMYGQAMNRFGVIEALKDCEASHGPDGELSPEWLVLDAGTVPPEPQHETAGWPEFVDWPKRDSQLHQQMYYKWVERAYKAGLRTMVIHGTNIEALCNVARDTGNDKDTDLEDTDCTDMGVGVKQVQYLYDIEKYVDAQEGGPGQGWFRIVKDPGEARAVIADGKLAVIPGLEFSNIFHCSVTFTPDDSQKDPNEAGTPACTKEDIDREIDEVWELGVRAVFPYHDVDSALGGTGIFQEAALNLVGFYGTQAFWRTYDCENGGEGPDFFYNAGAYMYSGEFPAGFGSDPISQGLMAATGGLLPLYKTGVRQCNARDVTSLGEYAIKKIMQKGFTLDIDHAEIRSKQIMLDWGKELTPNYPAISGHGGHGGINNAQVEQIIQQGGIVYPSIKNGTGMVSFLKKLKARWTASGTTRPLAMGYGADSNGLANLPTPRGAGSTPVVYPFTLFEGAGWSDKFRAAGIAPVSVDMLSIPDGQSWDMNEVGMAHYGLIADIVEEIRIEGVEDAAGDDPDRLGETEALDAFYNSAETYLQLWEQTLRASEDARTKFAP